MSVKVVRPSRFVGCFGLFCSPRRRYRAGGRLARVLNWHGSMRVRVGPEPAALRHGPKVLNATSTLGSLHDDSIQLLNVSQPTSSVSYKDAGRRRHSASEMNDDWSLYLVVRSIACMYQGSATILSPDDRSVQSEALNDAKKMPACELEQKRGGGGRTRRSLGETEKQRRWWMKKGI